MRIRPFFQRLGRILKFAGQLVVSVFSSAVGVLVVVLLFLSQRPLPLDPFVPWMQQQVSQAVPGLTFQGAKLNWRRWDNPFEIQLQEVTLLRPGSEAIKLEALGVRLSLHSLFSGDVWVHGLAIPHPELLWGAFSGTPSGNSEAALQGFLHSEFWEHLEEIELTDMDLPLPLSGLSFYPPPSYVHLSKKDPTTLLLDIGYRGETPFLRGEVAFLPEQHQLVFSAAWKDWKLRLSPRERLFKPIMHWLSQIPLLSGTLEGAYDLSTGQLTPIRAKLQTAEGKLTFLPEIQEGFKAISLGKSHVSLELKPDKISLTEGKFSLEDKTFDLTGDLLLPAGKSACLNLHLLGEAPLPFLQKIWPHKLAIKARTWIFERLSKGEAHNVTLRYQPGNDSEQAHFSGTMGLRGLTVDYLPGMPKASDVSGQAIFDTKTFSIVFAQGRLQNQHLDKGKLVIDGLDQKDQTLATELTFSGPIPDLLEIISNKPLEYTQKFNLVPAAFKGTSQTVLKLHFPLESDLEIDQIQVAVEARLKNVEAELDVGAKKGTKLPLQKGMFKLSVSSKKLTLEGPAVVNNQPALVQWQEIFGKKGSSRYQLTSTLTPDFLKSLGLDVKSIAEGSASASLIYEKKENTSQKGSLRMVCDLKATKLDVPLLNWKKPPGEDARLQANLDVLTKGDIQVRDLTLASKHLQLEGSAKLAPDYAPTEVLLSKIHAPKWDAHASFHRRTQGKKHLYDVKLEGKEADLSPFLKSAPSQHTLFQQGEQVTVQVALDQLHGAYQQDAKNVTAGFKGRQFAESFECEILLASGYLPSMRKNQAPLNETDLFFIEWKPKQQGTSLELRSYQAGRFLKFANIHPNIISGELLLTASRPSLLDPFKGKLRIKNFRVLQMPVLLRLLTLAPLFNIFEIFSPKEGMVFGSLSAHFTADLTDNILIHKALARNRSIGIFFQGFLRPPQNSLNLEGSMVPAYMFYQLLSNIPLLGDLLFGTHGRGLLATDFAIKGAIDNPTVEVNPLSSFAPGFLQGPLEDPT
jgi:Protein of unknown function/AsmA-like C-terminal region